MAITKTTQSVIAPITSTGTTTPRNLSDRFADTINAKDFGAIGDGASHPLSSVYSSLAAAQAIYPFVTSINDEIDWAAIQAAVNYALSSGRRGSVYVPQGKYYLSRPIVIEGVGIGIEGCDGAELTTVFYVDHLNGPGVQLKNRRNFLKNIEITGSPTRFAGAAGSNYGVLLEATDLSGRRCTHNVLDRLYIWNHPSDGILAIGGIWFSQITRSTISENKGHGIRFDNGELTSRVNKENPGILTLNLLEIFDNDGHGIMIGNDNSVSNRGFRMDITNIDLYRNAEAAGIRKQPAQLWAFCDTTTISNSAFGGQNKTETAVVTQGIWMHGRTNKIQYSRFLSVNQSAITIGGSILTFGTYDINVNNIYIFDNTGTNPPLNPAVAIDNAARDVFVSIPNTLEIAATKTLSNNASPLAQQYVIYKQSDQTVNNNNTQANDSELLFPLTSIQRAFFRFTVFYIGDTTADIKFAVNGPAGCTIQAVASSSLRISGGDTVVIQEVLGAGQNFVAGISNTDIRCCEITGTITTAGTAGNLALQWAQSVATVANTTVKQGSFLQVNL